MSDRSKTAEAPCENAPQHTAPSHGARSESMPGAAPADEKPKGSQQIDIRVVDMQQNEVHFKIKATTKLDKVINAFNERQNVAAGSLRFLFEGSRIVEGDTPESLDMANGDVIEAHAEQTGGSLATVF